jgi:hypothetical protein
MQVYTDINILKIEIVSYLRPCFLYRNHFVWHYKLFGHEKNNKKHHSCTVVPSSVVTAVCIFYLP